MERIEKLIFEQVGRSPDAVAVEHNGARLSYAEMKRRALQIGRALRGLGLKPGEAVGVYEERSLTTVPLLLGIWDAGGVVVPVNPNVPVKMLEWVIQNSAPRIVVTTKELEQRVADAAKCVGPDAAPLILTDVPGAGGGDAEEASAAPDTHAAAGAGDDAGGAREDICYIIYTSGSTGRPKGVVGSHRSLAHYLRWQAEAFSVTGADRFSQIAPLSFDFSLKETLVPLIRGARVCMADRTSTVVDAGKFRAWVGESKITVMCCVPTLVRSLLQLPPSPNDARAFQSVRQLLISGDMLRWEDVSNWRSRFGNSMSMFNLYGPTESTVIKLYYPIPEERCAESANVPVGRPIRDAAVLILDEDDRPCPPGQIGEVVILSEWLARGYVEDGQTAGGSFCLIPHDGRQSRAYKTGDLGRVLSSGDVELVGRKDRQVKIRGYRIELDGIEGIISGHTGVRDVTVLAPDGANGDGVPLLACFYTADGPGAGEKEVAAYAKERLLPQVMSLMRFIRLDELPLSPNGKVDRHRLKDLAREVESGSAAPARRGVGLTVRQRISAIWEELLSLDRVNPEDNFFEIGGDSMTAIRLLRKMREELHPEIKLSDLYEYLSVSRLSDHVEQLCARQQ